MAKSGLGALDFGNDHGACKKQTWLGLSKWLAIWLNGHFFAHWPSISEWRKAIHPRMLGRRNPLVAHISPLSPFGRSPRYVSYDCRGCCFRDVGYWRPISFTTGPPSRAVISSREVDHGSAPAKRTPMAASPYRHRRAGYLTVRPEP